MKTTEPITTIDHLYLDIVTDLDFIKIDAEQSDADIILGGLETISKFRPIIQIEHDQNSTAHQVLTAEQYFQIVPPYKVRNNYYIPKEYII